MGKMKEINLEEQQKQRRQINKAAAPYLSIQDEGDLYDAYLKLLEESDNGNDNCLAADYVEVWQPLENFSVAGMIEVIENSIEDDDQDFPEVLKKIDWTTLRTQKTTLLEAIDFLEKSKIKWHESVDVEQITGDLEGILSLIDNLQDFAVDQMGVNSIHVYDFEKEDEREGYNGNLNTPATPEPVKTKYKVWVEVERIETDKDGNETYHDEECPIGLAYEDSIEDAVELQKIINEQYGRIM